MNTPEHDERQALPDGVPEVWFMANRHGWPVNCHRFKGGMRHDGALWCVRCRRWEDLHGEPFGGQAGPGGKLRQTP